MVSTPREIVDQQAEDGGLFFEATTLPEVYLQRELRKLHAAVEGEAERIRSALTDEVLEKLERAAVDAWEGANVNQRTANSRRAVREGIVREIMKERTEEKD